MNEPKTDEKLLDVWVVYDHPRDQPDFYMVRQQRVTRDGNILHDQRSYGFRELEKARAWLMQQGLTCLARHPDDDPVIIETWL
jgi:hypothetical protein